MREVADWILGLLPWTANFTTVGDWSKRLREPVRKCLEMIGSDREGNAAIEYMREVRTAYKSALDAEVATPRSAYESGRATQERAFRKTVSELRELAARASQIRKEHLVPLRERVVAFREKCDSELGV
jgi:hypothetical protein